MTFVGICVSEHIINSPLYFLHPMPQTGTPVEQYISLIRFKCTGRPYIPLRVDKYKGVVPRTIWRLESGGLPRHYHEVTVNVKQLRSTPTRKWHITAREVKSTE